MCRISKQPMMFQMRVWSYYGVGFGNYCCLAWPDRASSRAQPVRRLLYFMRI